jgi:hypothetical protein
MRGRVCAARRRDLPKARKSASFVFFFLLPVDNGRILPLSVSGFRIVVKEVYTYTTSSSSLNTADILWKCDTSTPPSSTT